MSSVPRPSFGPQSEGQRCPGDPAVDWTHFLRRAAPCADWHDLVAEKRILITGAGGSIGSSLALLLMDALPRNLVLLDRSGPNLRSLYELYKSRRLTLPHVAFVQADILDHTSLAQKLRDHEPDVIFHAAALKHVAPLESNPFSALETNVLGTLRLLEAIDCLPVQHFVNLSTDKAVNPASVLGVSKRIVELLLQAVHANGSTLASVRLGNVLGSSGSVASIFIECVRHRSPIPITDPGASRYFLTREEAATFLLRALAVKTNAILLPEMGAVHTVRDLARFLLTTLRCEHVVPFLVTSLRDGEKRSEELLYDYELLEPTSACQLSKIRSAQRPHPDTFAAGLGRLLELVVRRRKTGLLNALRNLVPEFMPSPTLLRNLR